MRLELTHWSKQLGIMTSGDQYSSNYILRQCHPISEILGAQAMFLERIRPEKSTCTVRHLFTSTSNLWTASGECKLFWGNNGITFVGDIITLGSVEEATLSNLALHGLATETT
jgi:hypothetical protein